MQFRILSLLQVIGHPRDSKRISMLCESGFKVTALAFERNYHNGRVPSCPVIKLGEIKNRRYFRRALKMLKTLRIIRAYSKNSDVIYASGQDMAAVGFLATIGKRIPIIMEVGDIVDLQLNQGLIGKLVRRIERILVNKYSLFVVISPGFYEDYYKNRLKVQTPGIVIENKLEQSIVEYKFLEVDSIFELGGEVFKNRPFRIGYFGLLRDRWSFEVLSQLVYEYPGKYEILFAGKITDPVDLLDKIKDNDSMKYYGEYKSPDDLKQLYNSVDMVWACYDKIKNNDWNLKWGRPNRFFESCFFGKPVFSREGAHFTQDVKKFNIGMSINTHNIKDVHAQITSIEYTQLREWESNIINLPEEIYLHGSDQNHLIDAITHIIKSSNN